MYSKGKVFLSLIFLIFFSMLTGILSVVESSDVGEKREVKIGFADFLTIYHSYYRTKAEDERLQKKGDELQTKIDLERGKIEELGKKMNSGILSEEEKEKLSEEIEEAKVQIGRKIQEFKMEIEDDRRKAIDKLIGELRDKISCFGNEEGYLMIIDQNELIFSDTSLNLTKEIVDYINKESNK